MLLEIEDYDQDILRPRDVVNLVVILSAFFE